MRLSPLAFRRWARSFALLSLALGVETFCSAGSVTYNYAGNDYNTCSGTYCTGGPYALSLSFTTTLTGPALENLPFTNITSTVTSFTFTDGTGLNLNSSNASFSDFYLSTNASGNFVGWLMGACGSSCNIQMQTNWDSPFGYIPGADFSETTENLAGSYGFLGSDPGAWTETLNGFQGGTTAATVSLPNGPPVSAITGTIGGLGSADYYSFYWAGGAFLATGSITGTPNAGASYLFSEGVAGTCSSGGTETLNSGDSYTSTLAIANLAAGDYCIGIDANNSNDPGFSLAFNTPVQGVATPETSTLVLLLVGLGMVGVLRIAKASQA